MALSEPAPRRSPNHPKYNYETIDYSLSSPLGANIPFPCRGAAAGPIYKSYQAGSDIDIHITGVAKHDGGHCQFSITYDEVNYAVLKTVMGDCIISTVDYKVQIPNDAPNGNAIFVWTWFNKIGNREMYMNCVDIEIVGGSDYGSIKGKKMVIANLPGHPTFPEGFGSDYAKDLFESQPIVTISPLIKPEPTATLSATPIPTESPPTEPFPTNSIPSPENHNATTTTDLDQSQPTLPTHLPQSCTEPYDMCNGNVTRLHSRRAANLTILKRSQV